MTPPYGPPPQHHHHYQPKPRGTGTAIFIAIIIAAVSIPLFCCGYLLVRAGLDEATSAAAVTTR